LEELADSALLRTHLASALRAKLAGVYDRQIPELLRFFERDPKPEPQDLGWPGAAEEHARLGDYARPRPPSRWKGIAAALRRRAPF
jgi:hypothetical protein